MKQWPRLEQIVWKASFAKVDGEYIVLGSVISLTGKYSSNGVHTQNGYNMAVDRINKMGGVEVQGKKYKFEIIYYDDESNPKRAAQLAERLIKQDGVQTNKKFVHIFERKIYSLSIQ